MLGKGSEFEFTMKVFLVENPIAAHPLIDTKKKLDQIEEENSFEEEQKDSIEALNEDEDQNLNL